MRLKHSVLNVIICIQVNFFTYKIIIALTKFNASIKIDFHFGLFSSEKKSYLLDILAFVVI